MSMESADDTPPRTVTRNQGMRIYPPMNATGRLMFILMLPVLLPMLPWVIAFVVFYRLANPGAAR